MGKSIKNICPPLGEKLGQKVLKLKQKIKFRIFYYVNQGCVTNFVKNSDFY